MCASWAPSCSVASTSRKVHQNDAIGVNSEVSGGRAAAGVCRIAVRVARDPDARFNTAVDIKTGYTTRSILCMPIRAQRTQEVIGVAQLINKRQGGIFSSEDARTLEAFVTQTAVALENSRLYERFYALYAYFSTLQLETDFEASLRSITATAAELVYASTCCLYLHRPASRQLVSPFTPA